VACGDVLANPSTFTLPSSGTAVRFLSVSKPGHCESGTYTLRDSIGYQPQGAPRGRMT